MDETTTNPTLCFFSHQNTSILKALSQFHSLVGAIKKEGKNPHFRSSYTKLPDLLDEIEEPLAQCSLVITQHVALIDDQWVLITQLTHTPSGEYTRTHMPIFNEKQGAQGFGSGLSYVRRYSITSLLSLKEVDDDGEGTRSRNNPPIGKSSASGGGNKGESFITEPQRKRLFAIATKSGWKEEDIKFYCEVVLGINSTKEIKWLQYDRLIDTIEKISPEAFRASFDNSFEGE